MNIDFKTVNTKVTFGIILIFFGFVFLIREIGLLPYNCELFNVKNYPIYAGIIFLLTKNFTIAIVLFVVGILLRLEQIIELTRSFSNYILPLLLIIACVILIIVKKITKK